MIEPTSPEFVLESQTGKAARFAIGEGVAKIGRSRECEIRVRSRSLESLHAVLLRRGGQVTIQPADPGTRVWVAGKRRRAPWRLRGGDRVRMGSVELVYSAPGKPGAGGRKLVFVAACAVLSAVALALPFAMVGAFGGSGDAGESEGVAQVLLAAPPPPIEVLPVAGPAPRPDLARSDEIAHARPAPRPGVEDILDGLLDRKVRARQAPSNAKRDRQDAPARAAGSAGSDDGWDDEEASRGAARADEEEAREADPPEKRENERPDPDRGNRRPARQDGDRKGELVDQVEIDRAIEGGVEYLLGTQGQDGTWEPFDEGMKTFPAGPTAIALLALLESDVPPDHAAIRSGFIALSKIPVEKTYEAGLVAMALHAYCQAQENAKKSPEAKVGKKEKAGARAHRCHLSARARQWLAEIAASLADSHVDGVWSYDVQAKSKTTTTGGRPGGTRPAGPPPGGAPPGGKGMPGDHSNTQYAILGLRAAEMCGVLVDDSVWRAVVSNLLAAQESAPAAAMAVTGDGDGVPRGWGYRPDEKPVEATATMTSAGIAGLVMARERLEVRRALSPQDRAEIERATRDGLAWLAEEDLMMRARPGGGPRRNGRGAREGIDGYYLYGLERVGVLMEVERIGDCEWYPEGARRIIDAQQDDGSFPGRYPSVIETAFALLFLERATVPRIVVTGD